VARRRRLLGLTAVILGGASAWLWTAPAKAAPPLKDGWWTVTNAGLGFAPPAPLVPPGGLYIQNGFTGPAAISALTFHVDQGSAVGAVTLKISGTPIITSPPVACPITPAGQNYKPAQGGPMSDAPAYDCSKSQVTGKVSSDNTTVSFDAGPLLDSGTVAAVVLAGGSADQIAFNPPGSDALAVTPASGPSGVGGGAPPGAPAGQPVGTPAGVNNNTAFGTGSAAAPVPATPIAGLPPALASGPPAGASQSSSPQSGSAPRSTQRPARSSGSGSSARRDLAEAIGIAAGLAALVAYSEGFGLLGGRIDRQGPRQRPTSLSSEA
jgi:hypothetical protein